MKACVLERIGYLNYKDVQTPVPKSNEVLVDIRACGICSSDWERVFVNGTYHFPTIPGHELSGKIVEVGNGVEKSLLHKKVVVFPLLPCFSCDSCKEENYALCNNYNYFGSRCDGGFAEYLNVPIWNLVYFPENIEYTTAALCEPIAVSIHAINRSRIKKSDTALIVGSGTIGLITALILKSRGHNVAITSRSEEKTNFINGLGINNIVDPVTDAYMEELVGGLNGKLPAVVFECVGKPSSLETALTSACRGGTVVLVGNPDGDMHLGKTAYWQILRKELQLIGSWNSNYSLNKNDWAEAMGIIQKEEAALQRLITHKFHLSESTRAFDVLRDRGEFSIKIMFAK